MINRYFDGGHESNNVGFVTTTIFSKFIYILGPGNSTTVGVLIKQPMEGEVPSYRK